MIKIRLTRQGAKNSPFYRIVAIDESRKRSGTPLQILGTWHPIKNVININKKDIATWLGKGAVATLAVSKLLDK